MENIIRRNRTMFRLSILALVLYVLLTIISITSHLFIEDFEKVYSFRLIVNNIITSVMMIGYIAIYILWTPDNEGYERKRPTWQFVLLLGAIIVPAILNSIIGQMMMNIHFGEHRGAMLNSETLSVLSNIIYYTFLPIRWAMIIILLVKCERKAKKILIICVISGVLGLVSTVVRSIISNIDDYKLFSIWSERHANIAFFVFLVLALLNLTFTIIYTKGKVKEVDLSDIDSCYY